MPPPPGMSAATFEYVVIFTIAHEGDTPFMYNNWPLKNPKKDVTVGVGHALFSENEATSPDVRRMFTVKKTGRPADPGEMLQEDLLPDYGLTVATLAEAVGVSRQSINELLRGRRSVSPEMALRLRGSSAIRRSSG